MQDSIRSSTPRVAIITGGGSGVGRAAALALLEDGWNVAVAGRRAEALFETVSIGGRGGERCIAVRTDVTCRNSVTDLFNAVVAKWGRVDLLFNNAGVGVPPLPLDELSADDWERVVDTNISGMFYSLQQAFRVMKAQEPRGGRIINNGSLSAYVPRPHSIAYTASKHAVSGMTKAAALDGREHNIAVGQIDIGNAATELAASLSKGALQANGTVAVEPVMDVSVVGRSILHMANLPLEANVLFQTVMATNMPYVGRG